VSFESAAAYLGEEFSIVAESSNYQTNLLSALRMDKIIPMSHRFETGLYP
jgi:hypothetical protein